MSTPADIVRDLPDLIQACRDRVQQLDISPDEIDDIAGFSTRYAAKLLTNPPMKNPSPFSLFSLLGALGLGVVVVEDEKARARIARIPKHRIAHPPGRKWRNAKALSIIRERAKKLGRMGAAARMVKLTPQQRSRIARNAVRARWKRVRAQLANPAECHGDHTSAAAGLPVPAPPPRRLQSAEHAAPKHRPRAR